MLGNHLYPISPRRMCVSLEEPELVNSVLMFLSGYDTLEYSWAKATAVSMRLRILFVTLQNTNSQYMLMAKKIVFFEVLCYLVVVP